MELVAARSPGTVPAGSASAHRGGAGGAPPMRATVPANPHARPPRIRRLLPALLAVVLAACSGPVLANPPAARPSAAPRTPAPAAPADPQPVVLPRDDGPHDRLTEWWYYTGHLAAADGRTFGFEYVIFRAERGGFPVSWASHLAVTDESANRFAYGQRSEIGTQVDHSPRDAGGKPSGFALRLVGMDPARPATGANAAWTMAGSGGHDTLSALSLIHISEPTRRTPTSYAVFCLKKKKR